MNSRYVCITFIEAFHPIPFSARSLHVLMGENLCFEMPALHPNEDKWAVMVMYLAYTQEVY